MTILVVGAGPTGLTAALELARAGRPVKVIDRKPAPSPLSRAVGINNRSLALLEPSGATAALIAEGVPVREAVLHDEGWGTTKLRVDAAGGRWPFMLALPQDRTEAILAACLARQGVAIAYGTEFLGFGDDGTRVRLRDATGEREAAFDRIIGADGAHSRVRAALGLDFPGFDLPETWSVADFDAPGLADPRCFTLHLRADGRLVVTVPIGPDRFRAISNTADAIAALPRRPDIARVRNRGTFAISVRQVREYRRGPVFLAGDAAHCHSPAGGRGMNLGIEDAAVLVRVILEGREDAYAPARHRARQATIAFSERIRRTVATRNPLHLWARRLALAAIARSAPLQRRLFRAVLAVDEAAM